MHLVNQVGHGDPVSMDMEKAAWITIERAPARVQVIRILKRKCG
jgi:hypothetical protein